MPPANPASESKSSASLAKMPGRRGSKPGERRGGRKKGTPNRASLHRQAEAAKTGMLPAEMMLNIARDAYNEWQALKDTKLPPKTKSEDLEAHCGAVRLAADRAHNLNSTAAPYYNPKLATTEWTGPNGGPIQTRSVVVNVDPDKHKGLLKDILG